MAAFVTQLMQRSEPCARVKICVIVEGAMLRLDWNQAHASDAEIALRARSRPGDAKLTDSQKMTEA
jgi:hypothetical protein